jgi:hypothetical protein
VFTTDDDAEGGKNIPCSLPESDGFNEEGNGETVFVTCRADVRSSSICLLVKMGTPRKNYTVATKATGKRDNKVQMSKVQVRLATPANFKAMRANVGSQRNKNHKPGRSYVVIQNHKLNFSKTQAKVNTRRKI